MNIIWLLLLPYCALAFGLHGGELITGVSRVLRNLLCALPFGLVCYFMFPYYSPLAFVLAYAGANMGFDKWPLWVKGFVTCPLGGPAVLPLAYLIGGKNNVVSEYLSGALYGVLLSTFLILKEV